MSIIENMSISIVEIVKGKGNVEVGNGYITYKGNQHEN